MQFIDTHCHLDILSNNETIIYSILNNAKKKFISTIINVSVSFQQFLKSLLIIPHYEYIYFTFGISPNDIENLMSYKEIINFWNNINSYCENNRINFTINKIIAIGEIGLDYFHMFTSKEIQQNMFESQIDFASHLDLPIILHIRDAFEDTFQILNKKSITRPIIFHCYSGNINTTDYILSHYSQAFFSFAGNITYPKAAKLHESLSIIPIEKIVLETDSPYLSPIPLRGKKNEPSNISYTYKYVAEYKNMQLDQLCNIVVNNVKNAFTIKIPK